MRLAIKILTLLTVFLLLTNSARAQVASTNEGCIGVRAESLGKIVQEIETLRLYKEEQTNEIENLTSQLQEASKQISVFQETLQLQYKIIELKDQIIALQDKRIEVGNKAFDDSIAQSKAMQEQYKELLKASKPSIFAEIFKGMAQIVLGVVLGYGFR
jgi:uncharacterized protein (DUF3084 family)